MAQDVVRFADCQKQVAAASQLTAPALRPHWAGPGCAERRQVHHESWQCRQCVQCCRRPPGLKSVQDVAAEGDPSALFQVARGLMGLQSHFGSFATIKGAGASAAVVGEMLKRMRLELGPDCPPVGDCSLPLPLLTPAVSTQAGSLSISSLAALETHFPSGAVRERGKPCMGA